MSSMNRECYLFLHYFAKKFNRLEKKKCFIITVATENEQSDEWAGYTKTFEKALKANNQRLKDDV